MKEYKVDHPEHYNSHPSGVEAIDIVEYMNFCLGNAFKYVYRYRHKHGVNDLKKAVWYLKRQIENPQTLDFKPDRIYFGVYDALLEIMKKEEDMRVSQALDYIYYYSFTNNNYRELEKAIDLIQQLINEYDNV